MSIFGILFWGESKLNLIISGAIKEKFWPAVWNSIFGAGFAKIFISFGKDINIWLFLCLFGWGFLSEINSKSLTPEEIVNLFLSSSAFFLNSFCLCLINFCNILFLLFISSFKFFHFLNLSLNLFLSLISLNLSKNSLLASSFTLSLWKFITSSTFWTKSMVFKSFQVFLFKLSSKSFCNFCVAADISLFFFNLSKASFLSLSSILFLALFKNLFSLWALIKSLIKFCLAILSWNSFILSFNLSSSSFPLSFIALKASNLFFFSLFFKRSFNLLEKLSRSFFIPFLASFLHLSKYFLRFFISRNFSKLSNLSLKSSHFSINLAFS